MSAELLVHRGRTFRLGVSGFVCAGTVAKLRLAERPASVIPRIPIVLCGLGLGAAIAVFIRPQRRALRVLQASMAIAFVGSLFGLYEHIERNMAFALEIRPHAVASEGLADALRGVNPLLAPGILTLAAVLALRATYYPPALQGRQTLRP